MIIYFSDKDSFSGIPLSDTALQQSMHILYFTLTTSSTVGYGDIVPISLGCRIAVTLHHIIIFLGISFVISAINFKKKVKKNKKNMYK